MPPALQMEPGRHIGRAMALASLWAEQIWVAQGPGSTQAGTIQFRLAARSWVLSPSPPCSLLPSRQLPGSEAWWSVHALCLAPSHCLLGRIDENIYHMTYTQAALPTNLRPGDKSFLVPVMAVKANRNYTSHGGNKGGSQGSQSFSLLWGLPPATSRPC